MIARLIGTVAPLSIQLGGIYAATRVFPAASGLIALCLIPARGWLGAGILAVVTTLAYVIGYPYVPDFALFEGGHQDDLWIFLLSFAPAIPAAIRVHDFGRSMLCGYLGGSAAYLATMLVNALGVFGSIQLYVGVMALIIAAFMFCGYKVRNYFKCAVVATVVLFSIFAAGHNLATVQIVVLAGFLLVAVLLGLWCLPSEAEVTAAWDREVLKLAVATKWNNEMWPSIEQYIRDHLLLHRAQESLVLHYTREDFDFLSGAFDEASRRTRDLTMDILLGLFNRRWDYATLATTWNNMIDERDPMLKPESASFRSLRKQPDPNQSHEY